MEQKLIPDEIYRELANQTNLNVFLRNLFSELDNEETYTHLLEQAERINTAFVSLQKPLVEGISQNLVRNLPLIFVKDNSSRSGASYLRWRNAQNNRNGEKAWVDIIRDPKQSKELKAALVQTEKERIAFNMQMAIIVHIARQLRECRDKVRLIESLNR